MGRLALRLGRGALWVAAVLTLAVAGLWIATRGDHAVPALVTEDTALPSVEVTGHRLHLRRFPGPAGAPVLVVLHGGPGGDMRSLLGLAALADGYTVIFYDQRGSGLSERVPDTALGLDAHLSDLSAVIDSQSPDAPVILLGHSWGAMLATAYLARDPDRVSAAILIEPGYLDAAGRARWQDRARELMSGPRWIAAGALSGFRAARIDGPDPDARKDFLVGRMVGIFAGHPDNLYHCGTGYDAPMARFGARASAAWEAARKAEVDRIAAGTAWSGPVLFLAGACDDWLGVELQETHALRFRDARLVTIPKAGHDVIWDNPGDSLAAIRSFLDDVLRGLR